MDKAAFLAEMEAAGAVLHGHFKLSSGLHSELYLQCARLMMFPQRAARCCEALATKIRDAGIEADVVVAPAMGGVVVGYEMGRQLSLPAMFCERADGTFALRRGFSLESGQKVLVVEDVVTTGKSSREAFECIRAYGGEIVGEACLIDRSNGTVDLGVPLISLAALEVKTYRPEALPDHLQDVPAVKPGSRFLKAS